MSNKNQKSPQGFFRLSSISLWGFFPRFGHNSGPKITSKKSNNLFLSKKIIPWFPQVFLEFCYQYSFKRPFKGMGVPVPAWTGTLRRGAEPRGARWGRHLWHQRHCKHRRPGACACACACVHMRVCVCVCVCARVCVWLVCTSSWAAHPAQKQVHRSRLSPSPSPSPAQLSSGSPVSNIKGHQKAFRWRILLKSRVCLIACFSLSLCLAYFLVFIIVFSLLNVFAPLARRF